jgi:hypothetical protein
VGTYDGSSNFSGEKIYVNGASKSLTNLCSSSSISASIVNSKPLLIGSRDNSTFFPGSIDDVRVYARTLSDAEAQTLYYQGISQHQMQNF